MTVPSMAEDCPSVSIELTQVCTKCGLAKPYDRFTKSKITKSGRYPSCKDCKNAQNAEHYQANREMILARMKAKNTSRKDAIRANHARWYAANKAAKLARNKTWKARNAERYLAQQKEYIENNRSSANQRARAWRQRHPERAKITRMHANHARRVAYDSGCSKSELEQWISSQSKICTYCGVACESDYHVDHFYPLSRGGKHQIANLRIACKSCNLRKSNRDPHEFIKSLSEKRLRRPCAP